MSIQHLDAAIYLYAWKYVFRGILIERCVLSRTIYPFLLLVRFECTWLFDKIKYYPLFVHLITFAAKLVGIKRRGWSYFFLFFSCSFFVTLFTHIHSIYLVCPFLFARRASDRKKKPDAINICFYAHRQKLLRRVVSTFKYKLLGLRSHVNANLIAFTGILCFDFMPVWVNVFFSSIYASIRAPHIKVHIGNCLSNE